MRLYEWHLVLDDESGEPLWGVEERDAMIAAGVLTPVSDDVLGEEDRVIVSRASIQRWAARVTS